MGLSEPGLIKQLPRSVLSWDVIGVLVYVSLVVPLQLVPLPSGIRFVLVGPLLLFFSGYALSTLLFPGRPVTTDLNTRNVPRLGLLERGVVSVGLSVALLPLFAFAFATTIGTIAGPIVLTVAAFTVVTALLGGVRRSRLSEHDRFTVPFEQWIADGTAAVKQSPPRTAAVNIVLVASVLLAVGAVGIAFAVPQQGASFTEFSIGTEQDGEFVTSNYPTDIEAGEQAELSLLVENNEDELKTYQIVVQFERVEDGEVTEVEDAGTTTVTVDRHDTVIERYAASPTMTGDDIRLTFLLYVDEPPADPNRDNAYRSGFVWIDVSPETTT